MTDTAQVLIADVTPAQADAIADAVSTYAPSATVEVHGGDTFPTAETGRLSDAWSRPANAWRLIDTNDPDAIMRAITAAGLEHEIAYRIDLAESDRAAGR